MYRFFPDIMFPVLCFTITFNIGDMPFFQFLNFSLVMWKQQSFDSILKFSFIENEKNALCIHYETTSNSSRMILRNFILFRKWNDISKRSNKTVKINIQHLQSLWSNLYYVISVLFYMTYYLCIIVIVITDRSVQNSIPHKKTYF